MIRNFADFCPERNRSDFEIPDLDAGKSDGKIEEQILLLDLAAEEKFLRKSRGEMIP